MKIVEGYMPFLEYRTYYRMVGKCYDGKQPLLMLHGGPGSTHNYFEVLDRLADNGRAVITYDQLGCGNSYVASRPDLWHARTWVEELIALRKHLSLDRIHLLGQSWGGMLAIQYMCDEDPQGISSLILSSTLSSVSLWKREGLRHVSYLPAEMQAAIAEADRTKDYSSEAYQMAESEYMRRHTLAMPEEQQPECFRRPKDKGRESYLIAWGQNEFSPTGTLADWEYTDNLHTISVPTLVISGVMDLCTPLIAKTMYDAIPGATWELFEYSRHVPYLEENDKYCSLLTDWLDRNDCQ